uniref:Uncharacterized protein n=2 Tax=Avena sativa TaxID=4498 RepID=A0ACD5TCI5_AVESA
MDSSASSAHDILKRILLDEGETPTDLPLSLLKEITNDFSDEREIGRGGFAVVYKGMLANGTVAVKKLSKPHMHERQFHQEVECLMKVQHKNIVRFFGYCSDTQERAANYNGKFVMAEIRQRLLCFEYLSNGSLKNYIQQDAACGLEWRICYQIIKGICEGLHYLHRNYILHLDLKPANVLLDINMLPKIADFGLSKCFHEKQSQIVTSKPCGTIGYSAPESYSGRYTYKSDLYSVGVIIIEILTGEKGYVELEDVLEMWKNRLKKSHGDTRLLEQVKICAVIGMSCIEFNAQKRPDTQEIIDRFHQVEITIGSIIEVGTSSSLAAQIDNASSDELHEGQANTHKMSKIPELKTKRRLYLSRFKCWCSDLYCRIFPYTISISIQKRTKSKLEDRTEYAALKMVGGVYSERPTIHRDIESANIFFDNSWTAKITDFGHSWTRRYPLYSAGTVGYMDPEHYRLQTDKNDVYSFGGVVLELEPLAGSVISQWIFIVIKIKTIKNGAGIALDLVINWLVSICPNQPLPPFRIIGHARLTRLSI